MITVLGRRNSANVQKVMWTLGELGLAYQRHDVGGSFGYPDDYPNPNRVVPCIRDGDLTLYESNACVRYLARRYGAGSLWLNATSNISSISSMGPFFVMFMHMIRLPREQADPEQVAPNLRATAKRLAQLDAHLADRPWIAGEQFSMGDVPLGTLMYRWFNLDIERPPLPNIESWYTRLCEREPYRKHVMVPFGSNPEQWAIEERNNAGVQ